MEQRCRSCGAPVEPGQKFCTKCGAPCPEPLLCSCGAKIEPGQRFCSMCGKDLGAQSEHAPSNPPQEQRGPVLVDSQIEKTVEPSSSAAPKSRTTALIVGAVVVVVVVVVILIVVLLVKPFGSGAPAANTDAASTSAASSASTGTTAKSAGIYVLSRSTERDEDTDESVTYEYTRLENGNIKSYTSVSTSGKSYQYDMEYNDDNTKRTTTRTNIPDNGNTTVTNMDAYYDEAGRLVRTVTKTVTHEYTYDENGNRTSDKMTNSSGAESTTTYENGYRTSYSYAKDGKTTSRTYTISKTDAAGRPTEMQVSNKNVLTFEYDDNGNLVKAYRNGELILQNEYVYVENPDRWIASNTTVKY